MILKYTLQYTLRAIVVALTLVLMPNLVVAQNTTTTTPEVRGYLGATIGLSLLSDADEDLGEITQACANAVGTCRSSLERGSGSFSAYAGIMFGENIGAEAFYTTLGSYGLNLTNYRLTDLSAEAIGGAIRLVGITGENERGTTYGFIRIGVHDYEVSVSATHNSNSANNFSASTSDSDLMYGFGWQYKPKTFESGSFVFGFDRYELDSFAVNTMYFGFQTFTD